MRRSPLTDDLINAIEAAVSKGVPVATAAATLGISDRTVRRWITAGEAIRADDEDRRRRQERPARRTSHERRQAELARRLPIARESALQFYIDRLHDLAKGGDVEEQVEREFGRDVDGNQVVTKERIKRIRKGPNLGAITFALERRHPEVFGRRDALALGPEQARGETPLGEILARSPEAQRALVELRNAISRAQEAEGRPRFDPTDPWQADEES